MTEGLLYVRRSAYGKPTIEREERLPVPDFETPHVARVATGCSVTRRMAREFEFMKVEVRVELPCLPNETDIRETVAFSTAMIDDIINGSEPEPDDVPTIAPPANKHVPGKPIA